MATQWYRPIHGHLIKCITNCIIISVTMSATGVTVTPMFHSGRRRSSFPESAGGLAITTEPSLTTSVNAPLAANLQLATSDYSRVSVSVSDGLGGWQRDFYDYTTNHSVPLLGFKAGQTNVITVTVHDRFGNAVTASQPLIFVTGPLPGDFPKITVLKSEPEKMEPGYTLFKTLTINTDRGYIAAVDNSGELIWYSGVPTTADVRQLPNGDLFIPLTTNFVEINMLGSTVHSWPVPDGLSIDEHDGVPTDHGTILYINDAGMVVTNFPTSATNPSAPPQTTNIEYNRIVEISATNSTLLNLWSPIDMLDPTRIDYNSFEFNTAFGWDSEHANAVIEDPRDNSIIVSMRHQDAVIKFTRSGQLKWILGPHDNWGPQWQPYLLTPVGTPFEWNYEQHAPILTPQGTLMVYDDGDFRALPFDLPVADSNNYSRSVEFKIDEKKMEVSQVWDYGRTNGDPIFTPAVGNTELLHHTGNVLINFGWVTYENGIHPDPFATSASVTHIKEVTRGTTPEVVFDLEVFDPSNTVSSYRGGYVYRSHRIPDLYPVVTAAQSVADLITLTGSSSIRSSGALIAGLGGVLTAIGRHDLHAAIDQLHNFQTLTQVANQNSDVSTQLIDESQGIIDALTAGKTTYATERLTGLFPDFSPTHADANLIDEIGDTDFRWDSDLIADLSTALVSIGLNAPDAAVRDLRNFQVQLHDTQLNSASVDQFNFEAQQIIDHISPISSCKPCHLHLVTKAGMPCLEFTGVSHKIYAVEASTDMTHWEKIGEAKPLADGKFEFEDRHSDEFSSRYYRIVTP